MAALGKGKIFKDEKPLLRGQAWWDQYYFGQFPVEAYNPDELVASKGAEVYKKMLLDEQVKAAYEFIVSIIVTRRYRFDLQDDDEEQRKIRDFLLYNIEESIESTFVQALKTILLSKAHGFSLSEKLFKPSTYDGRPVWCLRAVKPKFFDSFELERDQYGNLTNLIQYQEGRRKRLQIEDFIYHVNFPELEPVYGVSDLRAAYKAYWQKSIVEKLWSIYVERMAGGMILTKPGMDSPPLSPAERNDFKKMLKNLSQSPGIIGPKGYDIEAIYPNDTQAYEKYIAVKDRQIARALFMPSLSGLTEQQNVGSQALAKVQENYFFSMMGEQADLLADTLNEQLFRPLVRWNFGTDKFPRFKFETQTDAQKAEYATAWREAVKDGVVENTFNDEQKTRALLNYPQREKSESDESFSEDPKGGCSTSALSFSDPEKIKIDFKEQEKRLDSLEESFVNKLSRDLKSIFVDVQRNVKDIYESSRQNANVSAIGGLTIQDLSSQEKLDRLFDDTRDILEKAYVSSRNQAESEIKKVKKDVDFSDRGLLPFKEFSVAKFVEGLTLEKVSEILDLESFNITGILEEDILKIARQVLIDGIENDKSVNAVVQDLKEQLAPIIGSPEIKDATGRVIFDTENQARLETIARTNIANVFNQGKLSIYTDPVLDNFVKAFEYTAILDSRTTNFCRKYEGFTRLVNDPIWRQITPPNHFNCRSTLIPITADEDFEISEDLPKTKGSLEQPSKGFGIVSRRMDK